MAEKLLFTFVRFFAGFFAYIAVYKFLLSKINDSDSKRLVVYLVSLFAGFFYAYNPCDYDGICYHFLCIFLFPHSFDFLLF
jgi:hypothetical protein